MVREEISTRQKQVLAYIAEYTSGHGYPPSVRDIGAEVGLASPSTVFSHLTSLEQKGYIRRERDSARAIIILEKGWEALGVRPPDSGRQEQLNVVELPLVGRVAAGEPIYADENIEDYVAVPTQLGGDRGSFLLTVHGESMIEAGINDGDYVVVREQPTADNGDIVVAMIGEDATVKTFYREKDSIRLQPQNAAFEPIYSRDVQIVGKVVALLRTL
jgi:repressor LexA